jgi:pyruvate/2-oxoglutarate dehydrogenase complex dihydrolipoamide dehydrogenase (E3) component
VAPAPISLCLPSKNVIHSAKVASYFKRASEFGITSSGYTIDMAAVPGRTRTMVKSLVDVHLRNFQNSGAELLLGNGTFAGPDLVQVDMHDGTTRRLRGKHVLIGTGTRAHLDDIPGLAAAKPLTHIEALELDVLPASILVLGGGYIGLEFAQALRRFGSQVSVLERNSSLLHKEDKDVTEGLETLLRDEGIDLILNATVERVSGLSGESSG